MSNCFKRDSRGGERAGNQVKRTAGKNSRKEQQERTAGYIACRMVFSRTRENKFLEKSIDEMNISCYDRANIRK